MFRRCSHDLIQDQVDAVIEAPGFHLADDLGHLFSGPPPSTDEVAQTPGSSSSSQSSDGCSSSLEDAVACPRSSSRKMVALAPAQPRSPPSAESQLPPGSRYHKRREQNRVAYVLHTFLAVRLGRNH